MAKPRGLPGDGEGLGVEGEEQGEGQEETPPPGRRNPRG
jgi:hypothetical protein